jgi:hypothetical protein
LAAHGGTRPRTLVGMAEYDVAKPPPPEEWLALEEGERITLVLEAHERTKSQMGQSPQAHAAMHVVVENRLAAGEPAVVRAHDRCIAAGLTRHIAVHALASVVSRQMLAMLEEGKTISQEQSDQEFDALDPGAWKRPEPSRKR